MADSLGSHIAKFNETLNKELGSSFSLSSFNDQVSKKKITIDGMRSNSRTEDLDFPWLSELEMVTEKIMAIASKYRTHLRVEKTVMRAEKAVRVDNYDIIATLKEPKFWKKKNGEFLPEYVYTSIYEIECAIYENRFLINLIDKMLLFLAQTIAYLMEKIKKINSNFIDLHIPVSDIDLLAEIANFDAENILGDKKRSNFKLTNKGNLLTTNDSPYLDALRHMIEARNTLTHVLSTPFYKMVKKAKPLVDSDVHITNMLAGDKLYAPCYTFYRKLLPLLANQRDDDDFVNIKEYHNYVLANILDAFNTLGYKSKDASANNIKNSAGLVRLHKFGLTKGEMTCEIDTDSEDHIDLTFVTSMKIVDTKNVQGKRKNKVSIDLVPTINNEYASDQELTPYFRKKIAYRLTQGYNNAFVVTTVDNTQKDDVIICSPQVYKVDANIKSMIESCIMFSEGNNYIYSHLCPVCGYYVDGELEDGNCYCANCESVYTLLIKGGNKENKETVWIKRLKNPEKI